MFTGVSLPFVLQWAFYVKGYNYACARNYRDRVKSIT